MNLIIAEVVQLVSILAFCSNAVHRASNVGPDIPVKSKNLARRPSYFFLVSGDLMAYTNIEYGSTRISFSLVPTTILHLSIPGILFMNRYRHGPRGWLEGTSPNGLDMEKL